MFKMFNRIQNIFLVASDIEKSSKDFSLFFSSKPSFQGFSNDLGIKIHTFNINNLSISIINTYKEGLWSKKILDFKKDKREGFFGLNLMSDDPKVAHNELIEKKISLSEIQEITFEDYNNNIFHSFLFSISEDLTSNLNISVSGDNKFFIGKEKTTSDPCVKSVNQVVINTNNPDGIINLFEKNLKIRLALDKTFKEWSGRMLFFRISGVTLEVVESDQIHGSSDFYGIGWHTDDFKLSYESLIGKGFELSEIRKGRKPGTLVSTLKNPILGIPTILIGLDGDVI